MRLTRLLRDNIRDTLRSRDSAPRGFLAEWTVSILVMLFGVTTIAQPYVIPSGSMEPTLMTGDHLIADKLCFAPPGPASVLPYREIRRGDIVVFRYPLNLREDYVKRVIGLPGDRIRMESKRLYVNGSLLHEPYVRHGDPAQDPYRDSFPAGSPPPYLPPRALAMLLHTQGGELVVPEGQYFVLGDNRDFSLDSRFWGFVPRENIRGTPVVVWWSYDTGTDQLTHWRIGHFADLARNFFVKTRWERTFRLVRP